MKPIIAILLMTSVCFGQKNFTWEKIDSVAKTKEQIYSDTKIFIAGTWGQPSTESSGGAIAMAVLSGNGEVVKNQSAEKHTIAFDDKDNGLIIVNGGVELNPYFTMNYHTYRYSYTAKFFMKENRYRVTIDNVHCTYAMCKGYDWPLIEPCEEGDCPKYAQTSVPVSRLNELMASLKSSLQSLVDGYEAHIRSASAVNDNW